jgi:hypothetical protein
MVDIGLATDTRDDPKEVLLFSAHNINWQLCSSGDFNGYS